MQEKNSTYFNKNRFWLFLLCLVFLFSFSFFHKASAYELPGLVHVWSLNGNASDSIPDIPTQVSSTDAVFATSGCMLYSQCLDFAGGTTHLEFKKASGSVPVGNEDWSYVLFEKTNAGGGGGLQTLFYFGTISTCSRTGQRGFVLNGTGQPYAGFNCVDLDNGTGNIGDNQWHEFGITYTGSTHTARLYIDGTLNATKDLGGNLNLPTMGDLMIGNEENGDPHLFGGQIGQVCFGTAVWTLTDFQGIWNGGSGDTCIPTPPPPPSKTISFVYPLDGTSTHDFYNWKTKTNMATSSQELYRIHVIYQKNATGTIYEDYFPLPTNGNVSAGGYVDFTNVIAKLNGPTFNTGETWYAQAQLDTVNYDQCPNWTPCSIEIATSSIIVFTIDNNKGITIQTITSSTDPNILQDAAQTVIDVTNPGSATSITGQTGIRPPPPNSSSTENSTSTTNFGAGFCDSVLKANDIENALANQVQEQESSTLSGLAQYIFSWTPWGYIVRHYIAPAYLNNQLKQDTTSTLVLNALNLTWGEKLAGNLVCIQPFAKDAFDSAIGGFTRIPVFNILTNFNGIVQNEVTTDGTIIITSSTIKQQYDHLDVTIPFVSSTIRLISSSSWQNIGDQQMHDNAFNLQKFFFALSPVSLVVLLFFT